MIETEEPPAAYPAVEPGPAARSVIGQSRALLAAIGAAQTTPQMRRQSARQAYESLRSDVVRREMTSIPLDRIKEITQGRLRLAAIEQAGFRTVGEVAKAGPHRLQAIPGVGPQTASQVVAAARQLQGAMERETRVRFDPDARTPLQARLLAELHAFETAESLVPPQGPDLDRWPPSSTPSSTPRRARRVGCGCSSPVPARSKTRVTPSDGSRH